MSNEIKLTEEQQQLFSLASTIITKNVKYYYLPFWFEKLENGNFKQHSLENLPEDLTEAIELFRK